MKSFYNLKFLNQTYEKKFILEFKKIFRSGFYISGNHVKKFEKNFSKFNKSKYSIAVSNGYDAIRLSIETLKYLNYCKDGDEVIVPSNSYIATMLPVNTSGLKPVFIEPENDSFNIDPFKIEKKINKRTKIIIVTHLYGLVAQIDQIRKISKKYNIRLIEDCSQAHGASMKNINVGNFGDMGCFSLFPAKNLGAISDAGIITTNNKKFYNILISLRNYGEENFFDYKDRKYKNILKGFNCRMSEMNAALLNLKLKDLNKSNKFKRNKALYYLKNIKNKKITLPKIKIDTKPVWHQFVILCKNRNKLKKYMHKKGYATKIIYPIPPHKQLAYKEFEKMKLPISEMIHKNNLCLPIEQHYSMRDVQKITNFLNNY